MAIKIAVSIVVFNLILNNLVVCGQPEEYIELSSRRKLTELTGSIPEKISSLQRSLDAAVRKVSSKLFI